MARSASSAVENNFVNGWITEATGLNFPENAVTDTDNYVFNETGRVERRLGIDLEADAEPASISFTDNTIVTEYLWESVAGDGSRTFAVQQIGELLKIYLVGSSESLSENLHSTIDLSPYSLTDLGTFRSKPFQYASGLGRLVVVHPNMTPVYLTYSEDSDAIGVTTINIRTRDVVGIPGPPRPRTLTITSEEFYDLVNQGWPDTFIEYFRGVIGVYPSDYDVWWLYKTPNALGVETFLNELAVDSGIVYNINRGNSPAPKGSVILNEFYQDRSSYTTGTIPVVSSGINRPSCSVFFAGRVFYAGVQSQNFSNKIYFSQIIEDVAQFGECFSANDPTSQYSSDLLPSDGGTLVIPEAGTFIKLWSKDGSLFAFASNGIWQITGSTGIGFAANDYTVKKLSKQEILSPLSFVDTLGTPVWWTEDGIYTLISDNVGGTQIQSLSSERIKTYFQSVPTVSKFYAKGAFNLRERVIQWLYRDEASSTVYDNQNYNRVLNYHIDTKAFFPFSFSNDLGLVKGVFALQGTGSTSLSSIVTDNLLQTVTDSLGASITVEEFSTTPLTTVLKYTTLYQTNQVAFSEFRNQNFIDWVSLGGTVETADASAHFSSGYRLRGEAQKKFQSNYLLVYLDTEETPALYIQGIWDYALNGNTGRWSSKQLIDISDTNYAYGKRRIKIRGHGLALQYRVTSVPLRSSSLIGWSAWDTTNGSL